MYLYNITLQRPTGIVQAIYGNFSGPKAQEIVVGRGKVLELLRPDENGKMQSILAVDIFGVIRALLPFRLTGATKDYIIVGSDSGRIVILEYNPTKNRFDKVHQETFGKSGCRRIVPGQYLAADPRGRAVMIGAIEKNKLVYVLNRDGQARLTISSPLEAHKAHAVHYDIVGVDVGFENPNWAVIELAYEEDEESEGPQKQLVFYELDLGLNHVVRKQADPIDNRANMLVPVPGGTDGPGGILVCCENYLIWRSTQSGIRPVKVNYPKRKGADTTQPLLMVSYAVHKTKEGFYHILQSELGDLYRVLIQYQEDTITEIRLQYFDTVPVANSLAVLKTGFLFVGSEFGNHLFYQLNITDETAGNFSIGVPVDEGMEMEVSQVLFDVHSPQEPRNLILIDEMESLSPILDFKVADILGENTPQIITACGRGSRSSLRVLRHGLAVSEMAVSPLPGNPAAVWTVRTSIKEQHDRYIVVSFVNATLVLSIGETVEEATDSGFLGNTPTLHVANIGEDGMLQIHPGGIRHIRTDKRIHEWKTPGKKTIVHAASNERQVVIALSGGDLLYFELDTMGQLTDVDKKFLGREVACLEIAPIPYGRQRSRFLAVGDWENNVRIFSLDPDDCLQSLSLQNLPTHPESLSLVEMHAAGGGGSGDSDNTLFLNIGLSNGVLLRSVCDAVTGELTDPRQRFLGARPVKLLKIKLKGHNAVLALSSRPWLGYNFQSRYQTVPLSYTMLDYASTFTSEQCPEGIVAISGNTLRIFTIERLGELFNQQDIPLLHTPRKIIVHPATNYIITIETDHNPAKVGSPNPHAPHPDDNNNNNNGAASTEAMNGVVIKKEPDEDGMETEIPINGDTEIKRTFGKWVSSVRLVDVPNSQTLDLFHLPLGEAAFSVCTCVFHGKDGEVFLLVGTAKNMELHPRQCEGGFIHTFRLLEGKQLQLLHSTPLENVPLALCPFQGKLLVGVGRSIRIYDMGKKRLLRKCENKNLPNLVTQIHTQGDRIYVSDIQESVHFLKYKRSENAIYIFADETTPRFLTHTAILDYDTVAGTDKFGNVFVSRLPAQVSDEVEEDPTGSKLKTEHGYLNGAPHKLEQIINFHAGETLNTIIKSTLVPGGSEALLYAGILGTVGALIPFASREDVDFFTHLEMHLRQELPPLCGRDHLSYRSYYTAVKDVIDGDLCEQYSMLDYEKQKQIADELDRSPMEVMKKLEDMRNRLL